MNGEMTVSLIVIIVAAIIILRFVARVFIKLILIIILAALALYMFIQGGLF